MAPKRYFISTAARLLDLHPQTLRKYERIGLLRPRLLSIGDSVQQLRVLLTQQPAKPDARRRLALEIKRIGEMAGL